MRFKLPDFIVLLENLTLASFLMLFHAAEPTPEPLLDSVEIEAPIPKAIAFV